MDQSALRTPLLSLSPSVQLARAPELRVLVDGKFFRRGKRRFRLQGTTYGPFAPDASGDPFPSIPRVKRDLEVMNGASINSLRLYHFPPPWFLELAEEYNKSVLIDIPWSKHVCFLDSARAQAEARQAVRQAVQRGQGYASIFAYSVGNEIPASIVRWH